jgi:hypothetical protein
LDLAKRALGKVGEHIHNLTLDNTVNSKNVAIEIVGAATGAMVLKYRNKCVKLHTPYDTN